MVVFHPRRRLSWEADPNFKSTGSQPVQDSVFAGLRLVGNYDTFGHPLFKFGALLEGLTRIGATRLPNNQKNYQA